MRGDILSFGIILLLIVSLAVIPAYAKYVDTVEISKGDIVKINETIGNTTKTYELTIDEITQSKVIVGVKYDSTSYDKILHIDEASKIGNLEVVYVRSGETPKLIVLGLDNATYTLRIESSGVTEESGEEEEETIQMIVVPTPLNPGKNFYALFEGLDKGELVIIDPSGWMDSVPIRHGMAYGTLSRTASDQVIFRVYDEEENLVLTKVIEVNRKTYSNVPVTIYPKKPVRGGGLVLLFQDATLSGTVLIIDSYTGMSNTTTITQGFAAMRIPSDFVGPIIVRAMDSSGAPIYQAILELSGEAIGNKLVVTLNPNPANTGQAVKVNVKFNGKPVDGAVVKVMSNGNVIQSVTTLSGQATLNIRNPGTYTVVAEYNGIKSNTVSLTIRKPLTISLLTAKPEPNKPVTVSITQGASYQITGPGLATPITGVSSGTVTFTPTSEGRYTITATLDGQTRTINVNVVKHYTINVDRVVDGIFSREMEVTVLDSDGNPANGLLKVKFPNGITRTYQVNNGYVKFSIDDGGGIYTLTFGSSSKVVNVPPKSGQIALATILTILLVSVILVAVVLKKTNIISTIKEKIESREKGDGGKLTGI